MNGTTRVVLYTRAGCHLCEDARALLEWHRRRLHFELAEIDVDADPGLRARYGLRVPVVAVPGRGELAAPLDPAALRRLLEP